MTSSTLPSLSHIVRPAGPWISSMICATRSGGRLRASIRSVLSIPPIRPVAAPTLSANSADSRSTRAAGMGPSCTIAFDISRISSSCSNENTLPPSTSPIARIRMAAFCGPVSDL